MGLRTIALAALLPLAACGMNGTGEKAASKPATEGVTDALIAAAPEGEWLSYGRDYNEQRFSTLTQVNDQTVKDLGLAWSADLDTARGQEATPLMHDGVLYVSTAWSMVKAYDARTGKLLWAYDPKVPREVLVHVCCDAVNRGVALYGDKLYVAALDGRLIALNAKTGAELWSKVVVPDQDNYAITGAPRIVKGKVVIGNAGAEYKARGSIAAFDAQTGAELWRFYTVPGDPAQPFEQPALGKAAKTWGDPKSQWWKLGGGGTVWDTIVYDPSTNLVLFGTGNAEPWNPKATGREGDSLYTSSIVAVNADTGQYAWHFQETPEDRWDFDSAAPIMLADLTINGQQRHVALHAPKNGYFYILDAKTGQFLSGTPFVPQNWTTGIDPGTGRPQIAPAAQYEKTGQPFVASPGALGAHSWHPMSFSPKTGYVYIPVQSVPAGYLADPTWKPSAMGFQIGLDSGKTAMPADKAARSAMAAMTTGALVAWDPVARKAAWSVPYKGAWNGGTLATAGNLVFQGSAAGELAAFSADAGKKLWSFPAQTGIIAAPMTYALDGEQYVAILAGWGGVFDLAAGTLANKSGSVQNVSRLLVFKLRAKGQLPPPKPAAERVLDPPALTGTPQQVALGTGLYARYCSVCHGDAAVAGGLVPDLRHSGAIGSPEAVKSVVIDGALQHNGMVSFAKALRPDEVEAIRQYVISRANEDKKLGG